MQISIFRIKGQFTFGDGEQGQCTWKWSWAKPVYMMN